MSRLTKQPWSLLIPREKTLDPREYQNPIVLYDYQRTRSSTCPKEFLKSFSGIIQTDGYQGYNSVENVKHIYCLAHIRRKYFEIVSSLKDEALTNSRAVIGLNFCELLYKNRKGAKRAILFFLASASNKL